MQGARSLLVNGTVKLQELHCLHSPPFVQGSCRLAPTEGWETLPAQEAKPVPEPSLGCCSCLSCGPRVCVDGVDGEAGLFCWFFTLYLAERKSLRATQSRVRTNMYVSRELVCLLHATCVSQVPSPSSHEDASEVQMPRLDLVCSASIPFMPTGLLPVQGTTENSAKPCPHGVHTFLGRDRQKTSRV